MPVRLCFFIFSILMLIANIVKLVLGESRINLKTYCLLKQKSDTD